MDRVVFFRLWVDFWGGIESKTGFVIEIGRLFSLWGELHDMV